MNGPALNPQLLEMARTAALRETLEKAAIVPPGDPAAAAGGGDPAMAGAMPGMPPGGAPPGGGDPAMAGAAGAMPPPPPSDPMLGSMGGGVTDIVNQAVQQALAANGVGGAGKPGAAGPGKAGKPDVAVELAELKDSVYKLGMMLTAIVNELGIQLPVSAMLGQPPETSDPMLAATANSMPAPTAGMPGQGGDAAGPQPPAGGAPPGGEKMAEADEDETDDDDVFSLLNADIAAAKQAGDWQPEIADVDGFADLLEGIPDVKQAGEWPADVGSVFAAEDLADLLPRPLALARASRERLRGAR